MCINKTDTLNVFLHWDFSCSCNYSYSHHTQEVCVWLWIICPQLSFLVSNILHLSFSLFLELNYWTILYYWTIYLLNYSYSVSLYKYSWYFLNFLNLCFFFFQLNSLVWGHCNGCVCMYLSCINSFCYNFHSVIFSVWI